MKTSTKERILISSRRLFNEKGYNSVSMQQIADDVGISKGNLTYHFKKKENIMETLVSESSEYVELQPSETIKELDETFIHIQKVVSENSFYFMHHSQMSQLSPEIFNKQNIVYRESLERFNKSFQNLNRKGLIREEMLPGEYSTVIDTLHMASIYWESFAALHGKTMSYRDYAWKLMYHLLTPKGIMERQLLI